MRNPRVPQSHDLDQSDIFLLGDAKRMLCGCSFYNADEALLATPRISSGIKKVHFDRLVSRMDEAGFETEGKYIPWFK
jgi:hypothetical protein